MAKISLIQYKNFIKECTKFQGAVSQIAYTVWTSPQNKLVATLLQNLTIDASVTTNFNLNDEIYFIERIVKSIRAIAEYETLNPFINYISDTVSTNWEGTCMDAHYEQAVERETDIYPDFEPDPPEED